MKKKLFALLLTAFLMLSLTACGGESNDAEPTQEPTQEVTAVPEPAQDQEADAVSPEEFIQEVKTAIDGQVGSGESILDVKLDGSDLIVYVDLSGSDNPFEIGLNDIAESRFSSITDSILDIEGYDDLWVTITVDFGEVGYATGRKEDVVNSEYGKYFDVMKIQNQIVP